MKIALLGFDTEGRASYDYFAAEGHAITICDQNPATTVPVGADCRLGDHYLDNLDQFDLLVRTPGLPPRLILEKNPQVAGKITSQVNEFFKASPTRHIIGVTGTKGKGTTSTLIAKMLEAAGKTVFLGGNIGVPPLTFLNQLDEQAWVVLELSSFQLQDIQHSPHIGVCLMVVPEHLNVHADMEEYVTAKSQLFARQQADDIAVYFADNELSKRIASSGSAKTVPYYRSPGAIVDTSRNITIDGERICNVDELKILGEHNWQNACAAVTVVWQITQDVDAITAALTEFVGLEHRLRLIRELDGVQYYDDSFGTTPETAIVAMQAFTQPKIVILGGSDKGASYDELARTVVTEGVRQVLLIGEQAGRLQAALKAAGFQDFQPGGETMEAIVSKAHELAKKGDVVLLSTGCASFDMFKNYKDRAAQFIAAVQALA